MNLTQRVKGILTDADELLARAASVVIAPLGTPGRRDARRGRMKLLTALRKSA